MIDRTFEKRRRISEMKKASSAERIEILKRWETDGLDSEVMAAEISFRTGIPYEKAAAVLLFEEERQSDFPFLLDIDEIASAAGIMTSAPKEELRPLEGMDEETAAEILECEDEICWEIGLNVPADE